MARHLGLVWDWLDGVGLSSWIGLFWTWNNSTTHFLHEMNW